MSLSYLNSTKALPPIDLFSKEDGDESYMAFKAEVQPWHGEAKTHWNQLAEKYRFYLDSDFIKKFPAECVSRLWELTLAHYIASRNNGLKLVNFLVKKNESKPDFCFSYQGKQFYLEATCASPGDPSNYPNINASMKDIEFKVRPIPISEYKERLTSAIQTKLSKYNSSYKNNIEENAGFVIAISMAKIDFFNQPHMPNVDISCVFPCSENVTIPIYPDLKGDERIGESYHEYNENFKKKNKINVAEIYTGYFSDDKYSYISAILISHDGHAFFPDADKHGIIRWGKCRNDFFLIRNPFAKIPLPENIFSVYRETITKIEGGRFEINVKEYE